jgi:chromosomal replication initiator protein
MMVTLEKIQRVVAQSYDVGVNLLRGPARHDAVAMPRNLAMYLCRKCLLDTPERIGRPLSFPKIGRAFGNRHHTTVMSACERVATLRKRGVITDERIKKLLAAIWDNDPKVSDHAIYPRDLFFAERTNACAN